MKKFKLSQSKDENLLKISSNKTNYEIKLTDNELSELIKELGFNFDFKLTMQEIETENPIDWKNLSFPEWFYQTSKLELDCYKDLRAHYMSDKTSMDNAFKLNRFLKNILPEEIPSPTKKLHEILTNPKILKVGDVVKIGEYECEVMRNTYDGSNFYFSVIAEPNHKVFTQFGLTNEKIRNKFNSEKKQMYPETKTLQELTKMYYYLKTFEV